MRFPSLAGRKRAVAIGVAVVAVGATTLALTMLGSAQATQNASTSIYLIQIAGSPVASYTGGVAGIPATKAAPGQKLNTKSEASKAYAALLKADHSQALDKAGVASSAKKLDYTVTFNGFAASLTSAEAARLAKTAGVLRVWENEILTVDTITTPDFLGLTGAGGVWNTQFGGVANAGNGVIVGILDSGMWPESASFGPLPAPRADDGAIAAKWNGVCDAGVTGVPFVCNNKLLGGRYYNASGLAAPYEFLSPRDLNGHGSHTGSTAAGNNNVPAAINGGSVGNVSGMAPTARLADYKVLWHNAATGGASGGTADIVAAIDDAVNDGVDVINYSISGSLQFFIDPVEIAFLNAAAANVFVAASAGNSGPAVSTVAHNSPWLTTVAASTHDRGVTKQVTLGNGAVYTGVGVGVGVGPNAIIDASTAGMPGISAELVAKCFLDGDPGTPGIQPALDPTKIGGKIVLCLRGSTGNNNPRVEKSLAVATGGGVGMVLYNQSTSQTGSADFHSVPSIHIGATDGLAVKAYISGTASPTATISGVLPIPVRAPAMAGFSSLGPAQAGGGDLLKPDITAPGVNVIAAVSPPGNGGNSFFSLDGTSMSSPHVAGIAALIRSAHPDWSPMAIKSAMMTTASVLDNTGQPIQRAGVNATPLDYGSGHVTPGPAFDPGLVYDSGVLDWLQFGCGTGQFQLITSPGFCPAVGSIDPSNLNYPTIASGDLAGVQTFHRTVTNVTQRSSTYNVTINAPAGFNVVVTPSTLVVPPHHSRSYDVTITRTTAPLNQYAFGSLIWTDMINGHRDHSVRSNIAVRPVALAAPTSITGSGTSGSTGFSAKVGYTGTLNASVLGLVGATVTPASLNVTGPSFSSGAPAATSRTELVTVTVPAGTTTAKFATFDADYPADTDIDIYVYQAGTLVGSSPGGTAEESVTLVNPAPGTYQLYVHLFAIASGTTMTVNPNHWVVGNSAAGNATVAPTTQAVTLGSNASITLNWSGLSAGVRYYGTLVYDDGAITIGSSSVLISA